MPGSAQRSADRLPGPGDSSAVAIAAARGGLALEQRRLKTLTRFPLRGRGALGGHDELPRAGQLAGQLRNVTGSSVAGGPPAKSRALPADRLRSTSQGRSPIAAGQAHASCFAPSGDPEQPPQLEPSHACNCGVGRGRLPSKQWRPSDRRPGRPGQPAPRHEGQDQRAPRCVQQFESLPAARCRRRGLPIRPSAWVRAPARKVAAGLGDRAPAEVPGSHGGRVCRHQPPMRHFQLRRRADPLLLARPTSEIAPTRPGR